jgi:hypothetical protein
MNRNQEDILARWRELKRVTWRALERGRPKRRPLSLVVLMSLTGDGFALALACGAGEWS